MNAEICRSAVAAIQPSTKPAMTATARNHARQLSPEMANVWKWFDANISGSIPAGESTALHPANYCKFQ